MKFLVIQQKMIGDVLTSTILCENLKNRYPDCKIHFVANEHTLAVLENNPFIDKVIVFKNHFSRNKFDFYDFLKDIKKEEYYAVIDVYGKLESNLISHFARAQYKIAHDKWYTRWVYTDTIKEKLVVEGTIPLAMHNRLRLLDPLLKESNTYVTNPKLYLQEAEMEAASQVATALKSEASQPLIMMGILGSDSIKTYPAAYMASIIGTICENTNAKILFNYLPHQEKEARAIYDLCDPKTQDR
ncbi:MAG: glycosyltransferase family 9 protein, partial [Flavobacteriaceae bacterium]